jgi:hypothetical protein
VKCLNTNTVANTVWQGMCGLKAAWTAPNSIQWLVSIWSFDHDHGPITKVALPPAVDKAMLGKCVNDLNGTF